MKCIWHKIISEDNPLVLNIPPFAKGVHKWGDARYYQDTERALFCVEQNNGKRLVKEGFVRMWNDRSIRFMIPGTIDKVTHWTNLPEPPD